MKYSKLSLMAVLLALNPVQVTAGEALDNAYLENYISQVTPAVKNIFLQREPDLEDSAADAKANLQASKMASCQLKTIKNYPAKYRVPSLQPVAQGEDIRKVTQNVNSLMKSDVGNGSLSLAELNVMIKTATSTYETCLGE